MAETTTMIRPEKVSAVAEIVDNLNKSNAAILTDYRGLTAEEMTELRKGLRESGISFKIYNTDSSLITNHHLTKWWLFFIMVVPIVRWSLYYDKSF
jgi:alcohol dehydrogenase class IV